MRALRALLLVLALSVCVYADGNIPNDKGGIIPNDRIGVMPTDKTGDMPCGKAGTTDLSTEIALYLLQSVLPLF